MHYNILLICLCALQNSDLFSVLSNLNASDLTVVVLVAALIIEQWWSRKKYAIDLLSEWNNNTADHAKAILEEFPYLRDGGVIDEKTGYLIYCCNKDDKYWDVRFQIVELLNHAEAIAVAIDKKIALKSVIAPSINTPLCDWYCSLKGFIEAANSKRTVPPWRCYEDYVECLHSARPKLCRLRKKIKVVFGRNKCSKKKDLKDLYVLQKKRLYL